MPDIFYDLETEELLDPNAPDQESAIRALHFSVGASICECHGEQIYYSTAALAEQLVQHDRIIGFNILRFDNIVLAYSGERIARAASDSANDKTTSEKSLPDSPGELRNLLNKKSFDLLTDIEAQVGHHVSLAALAEGTLAKEKMGNAPQAVVWYRLARTLRDRWPYALSDVNDAEGAQRAAELGEWFQKRLEQYCLGDAQLTKKIFEYGIANRRVAFIDFESEHRVVKVIWR
ncbi:MAG: hypothetical protein HY070_12525 [Chloroflexi bacterium]|nr:hypothetical protein [Chloroflexota bacterium]MBI3740566.1 hypothetical protein [Chloroflexota bacterium]